MRFVTVRKPVDLERERERERERARARAARDLAPSTKSPTVSHTE
jgi:hypothetical protein